MTIVLRLCRWFARLAPLGLVGLLLTVSLVGPISIRATSSATSNETNSGSFSLNGEGALLVDAFSDLGARAPLNTSTNEAYDHSFVPIVSVASGGVILGAPGQASGVTLGACMFGPLCWIGEAAVGFGKGVVDSIERFPGMVLKPIGNAVIECMPKGFVDFFGLDRLARCALAVGKIFAGVAGWVISSVISIVFNTIYHSFVDATETMVNLTFTVILGEAEAISPQLTCGFGDATNPDCISRWFLTQVGLMHIIGLNILVPLLLLVIMQSVIKGSMFFLLRAMLVMLPAAIIGGVVAVVFAQLLLNIVDQICNFLVWGSLSEKEMTAGFEQAFEKLRKGSFGLASVLWMLAMIIACLVILIELVIRQVAIYLAALFVPVTFATMVYPPTVRWARRSVEILVAFIFMKLFLLGGLLLGLAAFTYGGASGAPNSTGSGLSEADQGLTTIITGTAMFFFAAYSATKMMAPLPVGVGVATDTRLVKPETIFAAGDLTQTRLAGRLRRLQDRANGIRGGQSILLTGGKGGGGSGSPPTTPKGPTGPSGPAFPPGPSTSPPPAGKTPLSQVGGGGASAAPGQGGPQPQPVDPIHAGAASSDGAPRQTPSTSPPLRTPNPAPAPPPTKPLPAPIAGSSTSTPDGEDTPDNARRGAGRKQPKPLRRRMQPTKRQKSSDRPVANANTKKNSRSAANNNGKLALGKKQQVFERVVVDGKPRDIPVMPPPVQNAPPPTNENGNNA